MIPVGLLGTDQVWPRSKRFSNVLNVIDPPKVSVQVGEAVELKSRSLEADTNRIMTAISAQLPAEARKKKVPTRDELLATFPPGYKGDPNKEYTRRPGKD